MKPFTILLLGSFALNGLLACIVLLSEGEGKSGASAPGNARLSATAAGPRTAPDKETWSRLKPDDLPSLIARLRESGFPLEAIRAIVAAKIEEKYAPRRRALDPEAGSRPYWKSMTLDPDKRKALMLLGYQQMDELRALLGKDAEDPNSAFRLRRQTNLSFLPAAKSEAAVRILEESERSFALRISASGTSSTSEYFDWIREQRKALAAVLSPDELNEYDLRSSNTSRSLRQELIAFSPTEAEFRALHRIRQPFDEQYQFYSGPVSQEQMRQTEAARVQMNEQVKSALGPERYAEYERATDFNYRLTSQLVARLELPAETNVNLWSLRKEIEQSAAQLRNTSSNETIEERTARLRALQEQATARVATLLGDASRVNLYKQYGGQWIDAMVPVVSGKK